MASPMDKSLSKLGEALCPWDHKELEVTEQLNYNNLYTNVCIVKATVFPVVIYGCKSWTIKKAEYRRIDAFEL